MNFPIYKDMTNARRAEFAEKALLNYKALTQPGEFEPLDQLVKDLLTDLRHYCRFMHLDLDALSSAASGMSDSELDEDEDGVFEPSWVPTPEPEHNT